VTTAARILLVDDEASIQRAVAPLLRARGFEVEVVATGGEAVRSVATRRPDLMVLDLGLPDLEGTEVCRRIRAQSALPIIVLSARGAEAAKVEALELGADDYVTKPFGPDELVARIRVALRRVATDKQPPPDLLQAGDLTIACDRHLVIRGGQEVRLTPKEFELLVLLARNGGRVMTHRAILNAIWGGQAVNEPEHVWVLMAQLRKKLEPDPANPRYLISEPWVGYRLNYEPGDERER
jgi:two-component system KDP operon response regulator KdpE